MDWAWWQYVLVAFLGVAAGVINVLAGGGSNLILPMLMLFGLPPDVANGTNRVGIFLQSVAGTGGFLRAKRLPTGDLRAILLPMFIGGLIGALAAARLPDAWLKPLLLGTMLALSAVILLKPDTLLPEADTRPFRVAEKPLSRLWLLLCGFYGGFVQAGVGFITVTLMCGVLRYDMVRANALKLVTALAFTTVALAVFIAHGQVWWRVGAALAVGNAVGASLGVRLAIQLPPVVMKWMLFVMTLVAVAAALIF